MSFIEMCRSRSALQASKRLSKILGKKELGEFDLPLSWCIRSKDWGTTLGNHIKRGDGTVGHLDTGRSDDRKIMEMVELPLRVHHVVVERISQIVALRGDGSVNAFLADALNTYVHLGLLNADGAQFFARQPSSQTLVPLTFPFQENGAVSEKNRGVSS